MNHSNISTVQHPTHNPTRSQTYTVNFFNARITTVVTSTPAVARNWVYTLRSTHHHDISNSNLVVGLGVQWRANFFDPNPARPAAATLQLCVGTRCLIFQLSQANAVPATLRRLLEDERVTFVGVHNGRDRAMLAESWAQLRVVEVVDIAKAEGFGNASAEDICADVLKLHGVAKPRKIGLSNWGKFLLDVNQVQYACVDAYVAYLLAIQLGYPKYEYDEDEYCSNSDYSSLEYPKYEYDEDEYCSNSDYSSLEYLKHEYDEDEYCSWGLPVRGDW